MRGQALGQSGPRGAEKIREKGKISMKISRIETGEVRIPLVTPFKTALRTVDSVNDLIVRVTADEN